MKQFQWRVALCDDNPEDNGILQTKFMLEQANFSVLLVSERQDFILNADKLSRCHLALIDMQWEGVFSDDKKVDKIPRFDELDPANPAAFVKQWVSAIASWGNPSAPVLLDWDEWPRCRIQPNEMGAWIGALLTNIAPGIEIIFYSGKPGLAPSGFTAALGRFRDAAYHVETKTERASLSLLSLLTPLRKLQHQALTRSDLYDWFLAGVLLPKLLDAPTITKHLPEPSVHPARTIDTSFEFVADKFFPSLASDHATNSAFDLLDFYQQARPRRVDSNPVSALEHSLRPWKFTDDVFQHREHLIAQLNWTSQQILATYPSACAVARNLSSAAALLRADNIGAIHNCQITLLRAWHLFWATLFEPSCELKCLADRFKGQLVSDEKTTYPSTESEAKSRKKTSKGRKILRIDFESLSESCVQLKANGDGKLHIADSDGSVIINWAGSWNNGQPSFREFNAIVRESLLEPLGPYRGLPLVILFGLVNRAKSIRVRFGDEWHLLFGGDSGTRANADLPGQYQFEWTFEKE